MKKFLLFVTLMLCWSCQKATTDGTQRLGALAAPGQVGPFVIPPSWKQSTWFVDPANVSTCASDNNRTCSLATCGTAGDGPCATYGSIAARWGTYSPRIQQTTLLTFLSSQTTDADPVVCRPQTEKGATFSINGQLPTPVQTGTIVATVTAKNRTTPQLLQLAFTSGTGLAVGQWIVNATHPSGAFIYTNTSGSTYTMTQPLTTAIPLSAFATEVNTWASTDTYSVYNFVNVDVTDFQCTSTEVNTATNGQASCQIYHLNAFDPSSSFNEMYLSSLTSMSEMALTSRQAVISSTYFAAAYVNNIFGSAVASNGAGLPQVAVLGGASSYFGVNFYLDADAIISATSEFAGLNPSGDAQIGSVYIPTGKILAVGTGTIQTLSSGQLWGPGTINVASTGRLNYSAGAGAAAAYFKNTGGITINQQTTACLSNHAQSVTTLTCNLSVTPAQLDTSLGATITNGCFYVPGGGSVCNAFPDL